MKKLLLILACIILLIACEEIEMPHTGGCGKSFENYDDALIECGNVESKLPNAPDDTFDNREAYEL